MSRRACSSCPTTAGRAVHVQLKGERCEGPPQEEPPEGEFPFARNREIPTFSVRPPQAGHASSFPASERRRYDSNCCPHSRHLYSYSGISPPYRSGTPTFFRKSSIRHQFVQPDWNRFRPTNTVYRKNQGEIYHPNPTLARTNVPAITRIHRSTVIASPLVALQSASPHDVRAGGRLRIRSNGN